MDGNKKIIIKKKTKVFVMAPSNTFTGGPELLHQVAADIKKTFKVYVRMFYLPILDKNPIHSNFKKYKLEYSSFIDDDEKNILIIPEHYQFLEHSLNYKKIKKILWWLSVDNYFGYKFRYNYSKFLRSIIKIPFNVFRILNKVTYNNFGIFTYHDYLKFLYSFCNLQKFEELKQIDLHLAQSKYAFNYLKVYFQNLKFLSDYQRDEILKNSKKLKKTKKNLICYSSKSNEFIESIKSYYNFKMIKLSGFNSKQIINIYNKTKVYLDFGYHPGKDRMPREAALFNNCIITNKKGSAKNKLDIPINDRYKFEEKKINLEKISKTILKIFKNYQNELKYFKKYKRTILNEKKNFHKDLRKIFMKK